MESYPKVKQVEPIAGKKLLVMFSNNAQKIYDCTSLLKEEAFKPLLDNVLFQSVKADKYGYGVIWSDEIDLSESELWINGLPAEQNEIVEENIALYKENGKPLPPKTAGKDYSGKFLLRPGKELHKAIAIRALQEDESLNNFCLKALKKAIFHSKRSNGLTTHFIAMGRLCR